MRTRLRSRAAAWLALAAALSGMRLQAAEVAPVFEPACLAWGQAQYRAEKLFLSMELDVRARLVDAPTAGTRLWPVEGRLALVPGEHALVLEVATRGPGRRSLDGELVLDGASGAVLQYASVRGPEPRYRVYRFTASGPQRRTSRPLPGEERLAPAAWRDVDIRQRHYPGGATAEPVLEVSTLLYLLAASGLRVTGDVLRVNGYATSADEIYDVKATAGRAFDLPVHYRESGAEGARVRRAAVPVLPVRIQGSPLAPGGSAEEFEILGLSDVEFLLDPVGRIVMALRARVPAVGQVEFRLQSLTLTAPGAARCPADAA